MCKDCSETKDSIGKCEVFKILLFFIDIIDEIKHFLLGVQHNDLISMSQSDYHNKSKSLSVPTRGSVFSLGVSTFEVCSLSTSRMRRAHWSVARVGVPSRD